ncbi:MAG: folate family ECF transporter S component [Clostridia bacterium]|nr:folate family ECF transporter S component [Clostridia bacterium]
MSTSKHTSGSILKLVVCGMMIAVDVVLARLASLNTTTERLGLSLFAVAIVAYLYGPIAAMVVHGLSDLIGAILFPNGPVFLGFTLTAALIGLIYGLCFHKSVNVWRIVIAVVCTQVLCTLCLNTLWLSMLYNKGFLVFLPGRLIQSAITAPVQLVGLPFLFRALERGVKPLLNR